MPTLQPNSNATSNNFIMRIEQTPFLSTMATAFNLPDIDFGETTIPTRILDFPIHGSKLLFTKLVIDFLVDEKWRSYMEALNWLMECRDPNNRPRHKELFSDATISILTVQKTPFMRLRFTDCFPINLGGFPFATGSADPIKSSLTLSFTDFIAEEL